MTDASVGKLEGAFEVHLPELVRAFPLKAFEGCVVLGFRRSDDEIAFEDAGEGGWRWEQGMAFVCQAPVELARTVCRMSGTFSEDELFGLNGDARGLSQRTPGSVLHGLFAAKFESADPFVGAGSADAKTPTQLGYGGSVLGGSHADEFKTLVHCWTIFPRHGRKPWLPPMP